jgi:hypothetical protein
MTKVSGGIRVKNVEEDEVNTEEDKVNTEKDE